MAIFTGSPLTGVINGTNKADIFLGEVTGSATAYGALNAQINAGNGIDTITLMGKASASVNGAGIGYGAYKSTINTGNGDDIVSINGTATSSVDNGLLSGLQGYWQFNGNGNDSSDNRRNLDIFGDAGFGAGLFGQALSLTGNANQYAQRPTNDPVFNFGSSDFTVQVWARFNTTDGEQTLIEKFANQSGPGWTLTKLGNNVIRFASEDNLSSSFNIDTASLPVSTGVFHDFVVRRQGDTFNIFFDDNLVASSSFPSAISSTTNPLLIGKRNPADGRDFPVNGLMDEVAIWNRAISDNDIKYLYNGGAGHIISDPVTGIGVYQSSVDGGNGDDTINSSGTNFGIKNALISGGNGDDTFNVGTGQGTVDGGRGVDKLIIDYFNLDPITHKPTNLTVSTSSGGDILIGGKTDNLGSYIDTFGQSNAWTQTIRGVEQFLVNGTAYTASQFVDVFG